MRTYFIMGAELTAVRGVIASGYEVTLNFILPYCFLVRIPFYMVYLLYVAGPVAKGSTTERGAIHAVGCPPLSCSGERGGALSRLGYSARPCR